MGVAIDRFGPRRIALTGITLYASGVAFLSLAQQPIWTWLALWTFLASASLFIKPTVWIAAVTRSEEHTSELQSLMRTSYAVFCLKKKTEKTTSSNKTTTR